MRPHKSGLREFEPAKNGEQMPVVKTYIEHVCLAFVVCVHLKQRQQQRVV